MEGRFLAEYFPSLNDETGEIHLAYHSNLTILSKEETKKVIAGLQKFVDNEYSDDDIQQHNEKVRRENLIRLYGTDDISDWYSSQPIRSKRERMSNSRIEKGNVYLIKNPRNGLHKIGRSKNVDYRLLTLEEEYGSLELVSCQEFGDYKFAEILLHKHYGDKRVTGEWFCLSTDDVSYLSNWSFLGSDEFENSMYQALVAGGDLYVKG